MLPVTTTTTPAMPLVRAQGNAGPPQVSLTPTGGGLGEARPWGRLHVGPMSPATVHHPTALIDPPTRGDQHLLLRPVRPQDAPLLAQLLAGLSPASRRNRFHGVVALPFAAVQRLCTVDQVRHLALVVTTGRDGGERLLADARCVVADDGEAADFALLVDDGWRRRGLGDWALQALEQAAGQAGVRWLSGDVLADNTAMLALLRRRGFALCPDPEDDRLVRAERRLGLPSAVAPRRRVGWPSWLRGLLPGNVPRPAADGCAGGSATATHTPGAVA